LSAIRQYFVLNAAIRKPGVASLSALAGEKPIDWLNERLEVTYPQQGEYLTISLTGPELPDDLVKLVQAVADAYEAEVLFKDDARRLGTRDQLNKSLKKIQEEIRQKWEVYMDIAREAENPAVTVRDSQTEILLNQVSAGTKKLSALEDQIYALQTQYGILKARLDGPGYIDAQVQEKLATDAYYQQLQMQLSYAQGQLSQTSGNSRAASGAQNKLAQLQNQVAQYEADIRRGFERAKLTQPNPQLQTLTKEFQMNIRSLQAQGANTRKGLEAAMAALQKRNERSTELDSLAKELEQLQQVADDMAIRSQSLEIEAQSPVKQIEMVQRAVATGGASKAQQVVMSSVGGALAFALGCLVVGYLEFRGRRLNGPEEVNEGLGIRVVGTLPSLTSRYALDPSHPIVAQLTESIDGVRTILMHDSTSKRRQVVLVTSAATMEGRTTVASQLAASLARAGRRTLLVDGDLRRPALHALFDVPLEDGLCEVLRAEVDVDDVIRPTHAEGLWLLTAGYCDIDAIHALATEQMQPVFDKLRNEYDFVIIDGAPVVGMSDALIFGQYSDGAILSVRRDHSQMPKINHAAELLRDVGIRIIGAVVNGVPTKADDRIMQLRLIAPKAERELQPTG
jgi:capsular exopolysaccharide synthesis family protein